MITYKKMIVPEGMDETGIIKIQNGIELAIPLDLSNKDYREYLEWISEGNTPQDAN